MIVRSFVRPLVRFCALLLCLGITSLPGFATGPTFSAIYVFGDSYCDVGNIYAASHGLLPLSPPYYAGRFSNGPIWLDHVASAMGLPLLPSLVGGTDYAFGGALVTSSVVTAAGTIPSVPQQVETYLAQHGGKADPNALYVLEGGGNDILNATGAVSAGALGTQIAREIAQSEYFLRLAGATKFLIPNLLDVSLLPAEVANKSFASAASKAVNSNLNTYLAIDQELQTVKIYRIDIFRLFSAVSADATHFGFTNITTPCLNTATYQMCADPDHTLFWDAAHPTSFGHSFFAVSVEAAFAQ